jgi:hypothetical protein
VVHTLGSLLENSSYKNSLKENNIPALLGSLFQTLTSDSGGPLEQERDSKKHTSYEVINRDSGEDFTFHNPEIYLVPLFNAMHFI